MSPKVLKLSSEVSECKPLVNGVELLAKMLHPALASDVAMAEDCYVLKLNLERGRQCRPRQFRDFFKPWGGSGVSGAEFGESGRGRRPSFTDQGEIESRDGPPL